MMIGSPSGYYAVSARHENFDRFVKALSPVLGYRIGLGRNSFVPVVLTDAALHPDTRSGKDFVIMS
jgi:hypothetical protein